MELKELSAVLNKKGIKNTYKIFESSIERVIFDEENEFNEYITNDDGFLYIKVFLKIRKFGEIYTKDDFFKCRNRRFQIINKINDLELGVKFNSVGDTNPEIE